MTENFAQDIGSRIAVEVFLDQAFETSFPAQYYVKTCTVYDEAGSEFDVVQNGCSSDLTQTIRHTPQAEL